MHKIFTRRTTHVRASKGEICNFCNYLSLESFVSWKLLLLVIITWFYVLLLLLPLLLLLLLLLLRSRHLVRAGPKAGADCVGHPESQFWTMFLFFLATPGILVQWQEHQESIKIKFNGLFKRNTQRISWYPGWEQPGFSSSTGFEPVTAGKQAQ